MLGRPRSLYVGLRLLQGPVFFVNSRPGLFSAASTTGWGKRARGEKVTGTHREPRRTFTRVRFPSVGPEAALIPKLRAQFAEFLGEGSLDHLRTLILADRCRFAVRTPAMRTAGLFLADGSPWRGISSAALRQPIGVPPWQSTADGAGISTGFSIAYAFRPRLRSA